MIFHQFIGKWIVQCAYNIRIVPIRFNHFSLYASAQLLATLAAVSLFILQASSSESTVDLAPTAALVSWPSVPA